MADARPAYATCAALEAKLAEGWKIEPPVFARPHWQSASKSKPRKTYHLVLWRENQVNLMSIPESPEIEQFVLESGLTVDSL
ncbi:MAG: hypothetical protein PVG25_07635 [Anaerolineae bacterium]|jgi:hypothetical protein